MKKMILLLLLSLSIFGCRKLPVKDYSEKQIRGSIVYLEGEQKPYTGIFLDQYSNGERKSKMVFRDGVLHGEYIMYYETGEMKQMGKYMPSVATVIVTSLP